MFCENCGKEHDSSYGSGRFCSCKCSRGFSTKAKRLIINESVSAVVKNKLKKGIKVGFCQINENLDKSDKFCKVCGKKVGIKSKHFICSSCSGKSKERSENIKIAVKGKVGGYRENSGRGKMGRYKGYFCQSSYELAFVIYCLDHNIKIERNNTGFVYVYNEKEHKYYPDFKLEDGSYVEIKGFSTSQWREKIKQFPSDLKINVLYSNDLIEVFSYVEEKYGKNFVELYE
jgi:hypothetical protein